MNLEAQMTAVRAASAERLSPGMQTIMHSATERLRGSGILDRVIKPGSNAALFTLTDQNEQTVALSWLLASGAVVLSVLRGFW
jgi:hypothetical protein